MTKLPLILLPGLLCDQQVWSYQIKKLSSFADIIVPNLNHATTPHEMVIAAMKDAPPYFVIAGHSMGGWVALEVMKQYCERILGIALLNTSALPDSKEKRGLRESLIMQATQGNNVAIIDKLMNVFIHNKTVTTEVKQMLKRNIDALINQERAMLQRDECISILEKIKCPTLIIHSKHDAIFHLEDSQLLKSKIQHAVFAELVHCGHMSPMESPEEVTYLLTEWLHNIQDKKQH